jgi:predicted phosphate transport protein (TIGR00153 family)
MLQWFQRLLPRQDAFFPAFERHAAVMVKAAITLRGMVAGGDQLKLRFQKILDLEHEADGIAREVLLGLRTTFITPFDRADIQSLITSMDDSVDQCKATAKAIMLFEMTNFEPDMRKIADAVVDCSELAQRAVALLSDVAKNATALNEICLQITHIEGNADDAYDRGLELLYKKVKGGDALEYIRGSEVYKHLEDTVDSLDDVADEIQGIVIEHV